MTLTIPATQVPEVRRAIIRAEHRATTPVHDPIISQHIKSLKKSELWWASRDMTRLATYSADSLPEWTPGIVRPAPTGFMVWATPIGTIPDTAGIGHYKNRVVEGVLTSSSVLAASWSIIEEYLTLTFYGEVHSPAQAQRSSPLWKTLYELGVFTTYADHPFHPDTCEVGLPAFHRLLHVVGCTWLLMQQPRIAEPKKIHTTPGVGKKPLQRSDIQIISLRKIVPNTTKDATPSPHSQERQYHYRWMVKGHWRQQACGPGHSQRRPVYVPPHIKGPEHKPLKTDRVNAWRR